MIWGYGQCDTISLNAPTPFADISPLLDMEVMVPAWDAAGLNELREYLRLAVERVVIHPTTQRGGLWDSRRVEIEWRAAD